MSFLGYRTNSRRTGLPAADVRLVRVEWRQVTALNLPVIPLKPWEWRSWSAWFAYRKGWLRRPKRLCHDVGQKASEAFAPETRFSAKSVTIRRILLSLSATIISGIATFVFLLFTVFLTESSFVAGALLAIYLYLCHFSIIFLLWVSTYFHPPSMAALCVYLLDRHWFKKSLAAHHLAANILFQSIMFDSV